MRRNADQHPRADDRPGILHAQIFLAQVNAVGSDGRRDIGPVVDDRTASGVPRVSCRKLSRPVDQLAVVELLVAKLNHADARFDQRPRPAARNASADSRPSTSTHSRTPVQPVSARPTDVDRLFERVQPVAERFASGRRNSPSTSLPYSSRLRSDCSVRLRLAAHTSQASDRCCFAVASKSSCQRRAACRGPHADRPPESPPPPPPNRAAAPSPGPSKTGHRARTAHSLRPRAALPRPGSARHRESALPGFATCEPVIAFCYQRKSTTSSIDHTAWAVLRTERAIRRRIVVTPNAHSSCLERWQFRGYTFRDFAVGAEARFGVQSLRTRCLLPADEIAAVVSRCSSRNLSWPRPGISVEKQSRPPCIAPFDSHAYN